MKDEIRVIFRKFEDGQIIALFPNTKQDHFIVSSFTENGGDNISPIGLIKLLSTCNSEETAQGIKMLQDAGYINLVISKGGQNEAITNV